MEHRQFIKELLTLSDDALRRINFSCLAQHRAVAAKYANGEDVEFYRNTNEWVLIDEPSFTDRYSYRVKRRMILVNGVEVPAPESDDLSKNLTYYVPAIFWSEATANQANWSGDIVDKNRLKAGLVYLTKENAIARAEAMLKFEVV